MKKNLLLTFLLTFMLAACSGRFVDPELANQPTAQRAIVTFGSFTLNNIYRHYNVFSNEQTEGLITNQRSNYAELKPGDYTFSLSYINPYLNVHSLRGISIKASLKAGHKYEIQSKLVDGAKRINYWILDETTNEVVSGKRE